MDRSDILHDLDEVEFDTKLRGYNPVQVDRLLERARIAITDLRDRCFAADERARSAEGQLDIELEAAQQAHEEATLTLKEARNEATLTLKEARDEATRIVDTARTQAKELVAASENEIKLAIETGRQKLIGELAAVRSHRDKTWEQIELMERQVAAHRDRILIASEDIRTLMGSFSIAVGLPVGSNSDDLVSKFAQRDDGGHPSLSRVADSGGVVHRISEAAFTEVADGISEDTHDRVMDFPASKGLGGKKIADVEAFFANEDENYSGSM